MKNIVLFLLNEENDMTLEDIKEKIESGSSYIGVILRNANTINGVKNCVSVDIEDYSQLIELTKGFTFKEKQSVIGITRLK